MTITEPITMLTDYVIAVESFIIVILLAQILSGQRQQQIAMSWWLVSFGLVGVAAALGGTCHGFTYYLSNAAIRSLWAIMLFALSFASLCMLIATVITTLPRRVQKWFLIGATVKSCIYLAWATIHSHFVYAIVDYLSAMLVVLLLQGWALLRVWIAYRQPNLSRASSRNPIPTPKAAGWIVAGVLVSGLAVGVQGLQLTIAALNSNDLYHLVQVVALYLLYCGASNL